LVDAPALAQGSTVYAITPQNSKVEWTGSKVTGNHDGSFTRFTGAVDLVEGSIIKSRVTLDIDTTTLATNPDKLGEHLRSPDFFDVAKFPKATFVTTAITPGGEKATHTITGNLDLHGVKKSISFPATITMTPAAIDATSSFSINRKDFGLVYPGKPDDLIRDNVLIKLTIHAEKKA
jgi:polyisoprenoid-binding protein YceI